jgi:hypothetical protein
MPTERGTHNASSMSNCRSELIRDCVPNKFGPTRGFQPPLFVETTLSVEADSWDQIRKSGLLGADSWERIHPRFFPE